MNNEEYIASGMLELYAAGALTPGERVEVERMAAGSPEIRAALMEACATMENYALSYAVEPKPELKARVLQQITGEQPVIAEEETPVHPIYKDYEKDSSPYKWMFAASIVLFLLSGFMSFRFYQNWQEAEGRLAVALASEQTLAQNYRTVSDRVEQQELILSLLRDEDFTPVRLKGVAAHPDARVMVYWNPKQKQVYLDVFQLPEPPAGKQYQLWALDQGNPINAGMIALDTDKPSVQRMKEISTAQAFAITLEPSGGSVNPTLEEMYVMGEIKS
ncbi:anti-sigma factor domain-containing protein [Pontibacter locisalis]|uniref:Regulator of SigK n=1 Tax=Pontibacter locisalis TaxID=1719035 RepID=A0ABW5IK93_9BACT